MPAMNLTSLIADVRNLIGYGAYDRLFSDYMTTDALNFACSQTAELLGITRVDAMLGVTGNAATLPTGVALVLDVQIGTTVTAPPGAFTAVWNVPQQEGFLTLPLEWEVDVLPLGSPTPVTYAWTMTTTMGGTIAFSPSNARDVFITAASLHAGEYVKVSCTVTVPGQAAQVLTQSVQYVGV